MRKLLTPAILAIFLFNSCKKDDSSSPAYPEADYKGFSSQNTGAMHIYTGSGEVTDPAVISRFLAGNARNFVAAGATLTTDALDTVYLHRSRNGDMTFQGIPFSVTYTGNTLDMHQADTLTDEDIISGGAAFFVPLHAAYLSNIRRLVNDYNSYEIAYVDPSDLDKLINKSVANFRFEQNADTIYIPFTNTIFDSNPGGSGSHSRIGYYYPLYAIPLSLPTLNPGDTFAVQQGTIKAIRQ